MDDEDQVEGEGRVEAFRATMGQSAMRQMDAVDEGIMNQLAILWSQAALTAEMLVERGSEPPKAIQEVVAFVTGCLVKTIHVEI